MESQAPVDPQREQAERDFLEKGLHFYEQLAERPGTSAEARLEMGRALSSIGHIRLGLGHFLESERAWRQTARLFGELSKQFPDIAEYAVEQADACHWLYIPLTNTGRNQEAEQVTREALAIFEHAAVTLPSDRRTRKGLAVCHDRLARLQARTGRLAEAMRGFQDAERAYAKLAAEFPLETDYRAGPADLRVVLAPCLAKLGRPREAAAAYAGAAAMYERLVIETARPETTPTTTHGAATTVDENAWYRHELGYACGCQGDVLRHLGQLAEAEAVLCRGLEVHAKLAADFPNVMNYQSRLAWNELKLGEVRNARGDRPAAEKIYGDAAARLERMKANDAVQGTTYEALGRFYKEDGRISKSLDARRKSLAVWKTLVAETNERDHRWHLAGSYSHVGRLLLETKQTEEAIASLLQARELWEALVHEFPESDDCRTHLFQSNTALSEALGSAGRHEEANGFLCKAADIAEKAALRSPGEGGAVRQIHEALAGGFLRAGSISAAVKSYSLAIQQRPLEPGVRERRAAFYARLGLWELAARDAASAAELDPAAFTYHWLQYALLSLQSGDLATYRQICRRLPERFALEADCGDRASELARACMLTPAVETDLSWAMHMAEKAVERSPHEPWQHFTLALARYRSGDDEGAIAALGNASGWLSGRLSNPVLAMAHHRLGRGRDSREALDGATYDIDALAEGFLRDPVGFMPMFWWDWLCYLMLYREARTVIEGSAPPDDARLIVAQARAWAALGEIQQADAACRRAIECRGQNADVCVACASIYAASEKWLEAESATRQAIRLQPYVPNTHFMLALAAMSLGKHAEAIDECHEAICLNPDYANAHNNLAWSLATCPEIALRDPLRAVVSAKHAVELAPTTAGYWNTLGAAQYRAGDWQAAIEALNKSMELRNGGDASDWFFLAMAHWQQGDKENARNWYGQAVEWMDKHQPHDEELKRFRAEAAELLALGPAEK